MGVMVVVGGDVHERLGRIYVLPEAMQNTVYFVRGPPKEYRLLWMCLGGGRRARPRLSTNVKVMYDPIMA